MSASDNDSSAETLDEGAAGSRAIALMFAREEWALYKRSGNGSFAWDAYRVWRAAAPGEPLPKALLGFFDSCAQRLLIAATPQEITTAVGLSQGRTGPLAERGGGTGSRMRAQAMREREGIAMFLLGRFQQCEKRGEKPDHKEIYSSAAKMFGRSVRGVQNIATEFGLRKSVTKNR